MELKELTEFQAGPAIIIVWVKGTVDRQEFADAYFQNYGDTLEEKDIFHTVARHIPNTADGGCAVLYFDQEPGRGAFEITYYYCG